MGTIYDCVGGSGFVVVLANHEGYILEIIGDDHIVTSIQRGNFIPGALWSEEEAGTNGLGTAIKTGKPIQVFASEHYCRVARQWTCSGSPIFDPEGKLVGVIDMTGPFAKAHPHTLGMVVAAARAIENDLRARKALADSEMADSFKNTVISSIPEGLIAVDSEGCISLINDNAKKMLRLYSSSLLGKNIRSIFGEKNELFINYIYSNETLSDTEITINTQGMAADYTLTVNPISSSNNQGAGKIIILNELKRARKMVTSMIGAKANFQFSDIVGANVKFVETLKQAQKASLGSANVLLLGPSGTGKDIFAQAIHNHSNRSNCPYIAINCAAIPRDLIVSELFGYSEGAFTGSRRGGNPGKFELADGGTIFLDEIGETPLELQAALLRVIEDKLIMRVGGKNVTHVDVRIIAATNKNLKEEVNKRLFRDDLYYRLNVFAINIMPLKDRKDDIPTLVDYFVNKVSHNIGKNIEKIDRRVLEVFYRYSWPGNIRELQNLVERMVNIAPSDKLTVDLVPPEMFQNQPSYSHSYETSSLKNLEYQMILKMMQSSLSKKEVANKLNIGRSTLYRKLKKYQIHWGTDHTTDFPRFGGQQ